MLSVELNPPDRINSHEDPHGVGDYRQHGDGAAPRKAVTRFKQEYWHRACNKEL